MGEFNAKVGKKQNGVAFAAGPHGIGETKRKRDENGAVCTRP